VLSLCCGNNSHQSTKKSMIVIMEPNQNDNISET